MCQDGSDLIPEVSSSNLLCLSNKKASCLREAADVDPQSLKLSVGCPLAETMGRPEFPALCIFGST